ncbi:NXPE family member 2-like isoform X2 [Rana temporaria]|uniref:NXPE family member 2-like isoform X2 n=1 Tax=Rana temporaria TaxID=8407 RepID=UPI001AAE1673|nr:NXPE family member 2-like isoform X2 [Rana temporaria]
MFESTRKGYMIILFCTVIVMVVFSYIVQINFRQLSDLYFLNVKNDPAPVCEHVGYIPTESKTIDQQIAEIMTMINCTIPQKNTMFFNETTSAINSTAIILNDKPNYCVGDTLIVQVEMFNYLGRRKTYGGDFIQARIFSPKLGAGASGRIEDFKNGTYYIYFTLFWKGQVQISILLMHPSEGVSLLWKGRNMGYNYISYTGEFLNKNKKVHTECGFYLNSQNEKCKYVDRKYREVFYCIKLPEVPCDAFISLKSKNTPYTYLTNANKTLFSMSNIGIEIPKQVGSIDVLKCPNLKSFNTHNPGVHKSFIVFNLQNNIYIQSKKHGHPFVTLSFYSVKDHAYIANELDRLAGGSNTIVVLSVGQHFRPFPFPLFIKRLLNIRRAIESLFLRSPDTKVIIKSENTREIKPDVERFSDFHGYIQYLLVKDIFSGLNVGMVDAWDMTTAFGSRNVHPGEDIIKNQINLFLSYIC